MSISLYKSKLGLKEEKPLIHNSLKSEKRYLTIIQYIYAKTPKKLYRFIGTHSKAISDPKASYLMAKEDLLSKVKKEHPNAALSIIVVEQTWATVKASSNILSIEEYQFQPINTRWLTWEEIKQLCLENTAEYQ